MKIEQTAIIQEIHRRADKMGVDDNGGFMVAVSAEDYRELVAALTEPQPLEQAATEARILGYADSGGGIRWREDAGGYMGHLWSGAAPSAPSSSGNSLEGIVNGYIGGVEGTLRGIQTGAPTHAEIRYLLQGCLDALSAFRSAVAKLGAR